MRGVFKDLDPRQNFQGHSLAPLGPKLSSSGMDTKKIVQMTPQRLHGPQQGYCLGLSGGEAWVVVTLMLPCQQEEAFQAAGSSSSHVFAPKQGCLPRPRNSDIRSSLLGENVSPAFVLPGETFHAQGPSDRSP